MLLTWPKNIWVAHDDKDAYGDIFEWFSLNQNLIHFTFGGDANLKDSEFI